MKRIAILGSTGSIGRSTLDVIRNFPDRFQISYLVANRNIELLQEQVEEFRPKNVAVLDEDAATLLRHRMNGMANVAIGDVGLLELIDGERVDLLVSAFVGFAGLKPTLQAINNGISVALANKETLVVAGELIMRRVRERGVSLIPIDSEHSAIIQCLVGEDRKSIAKLILTASGGPFLQLAKEEFADVTVERALKHPNWQMGRKVTIDSATLMNKGLEVIEAHWLFDLPPERIDVVIHPQSIIHSMVEFVDGSVKAQLGLPDMKLPIQYALTYPDRVASEFPRVNFAELGAMHFHSPDMEKFECLALAYRALRMGGTAPAILNAANEIAVELFLERQIRFSDIPVLIKSALDGLSCEKVVDLEIIEVADKAARAFVRSAAANLN